MSDRITDKHLETLCATINKVTGQPERPWVREGDKLTAQIGNYHISGAYGGVSLHQMVNDAGGIRQVFGYGYMPKRALYEQMHAFLRGLETRKEAA